MSRSRSIFFKYFHICSAVILISFLCLGSVLLLVSSRYFIGEKKDLMTNNLLKAVDDTQTVIKSTIEINNSIVDADGKYLWVQTVSEILDAYSHSSNAEFFVTDKGGKIIASSDVLETSERKCTIPEKTLKTITDKPSYVESTLNNFFSKNHHNIMMSFQTKKNNTGIEHETFYLLVSAPVSDQDMSVMSMMKLYLISSAVVALVIIYIVTWRLTTPIKEMAEAAKKIGEADFSPHLPQYDVTEYNELGNAINEMAVSLANYDKMRTGFVANVSHELRTPMTSIGGFVDGIIDGTIPKSQEKQYLRKVSQEIKRLTRLVKSMLNLAKIESGSMKPDMKIISIIEPIADCLFSFESRIESKNLDILGLDVDRIKVYADNDLIHQVFYNLIENAIKFVNKDGYIKFDFDVEEETTEISITNSGEGLAEGDLPLVFDRFYKTDHSRGEDATGVGLGLNIVKSIVKLHGGKISVTSVKGEYTKFIIELRNKP